MKLAAAAIAALTLALVAPAGAVVPPRGDLVVTGSATPNPASGGGQVTYTVFVKNDGTFSATKVLVTMQLPPGPQFVKCAVQIKGQLCTLTGNVVSTTYATLKAHVSEKISLTLQLPTVTGSPSYQINVKAHADDAIGGEEPRDGQATVAATVLSNSIKVTFQPSGRTGTITCGDNLDTAFFGSDQTAELSSSLGCPNSQVAIKISASGKTLDLKKFKLVATATGQIKGTIGILVLKNATNVTIVGGATKSSSGLEYWDYCLMDQGGNTGLTVKDLRCFRARSAAIDFLSDAVTLSGVLVDRVTPAANTTAEVPGGVGIHLSGNTDIRNTIIRRAANIALWADGAGDPDGNKRGVTMDGNTATSRIEGATGIGILLEGAFHQIKNTYLEGDGDDGLSKSALVINASDVVVDGVEVSEFAGNGFDVSGDRVGIDRSSVENIGGDGFVSKGAFTRLGGNSVSRIARGFVVSGTDATLETNVSENTLGDAFVVSGDRATLKGNSAKKAKKDAYLLSGNGGTYNTNRAESNEGNGYVISGNQGHFEGNTSKSQRKGVGYSITGTENTFNTNSAEKNGGKEWVIAPGNVDQGSNKKNGKTFTFTPAGGSFE